MKYAADFRYLAREALRGKWLIAIIAGLVATVLGGGGNTGPSFNFHFDDSGLNASLDVAGQSILSTNGGLDHHVIPWIVGGALYIFAAVLILAIVYFVLGSLVEVIYAQFNLNLMNRTEQNFENLLAPVANWKTVAVSRLLRSVYVLLWTLLLVIPGIVASYRYAMTGYILAERPELSAGEAIELSKEMMDGNKWRLFCLDLSFIGWTILAALTMGIGGLWLTPYTNAARAAFYQDVSRYV